MAAHDSEVVGHELHGDDRQNSLQTIHRLRDANGLEVLVADLGVAFAADHNRSPSTGNNLLQRAQRFLSQKKQSGGDNEPWGVKQSTRKGKGYIMNGVLCKNKDDGAVFVNQSQRSVLQLSGENAFAVKICELLDFLLTERNNQEMNGVPKNINRKKEEKKKGSPVHPRDKWHVDNPCPGQ